VTHGFDSANCPLGLRNHQRNCVAGDSKIINETASTGDACIRQRKQPVRPQKSSTKLLPRVTHAFDSANSPCSPEIFNETASTGAACIRQRKQPQRPQKSSTKLFPLGPHAFDSANSPCGLRNLQRNCFHWSRMDSTAQTALGA